MLKVIIVDDEIPVLNLLKMFLEKTGQVKVLETFTEPSAALDKISKLKLDVAFLDIEMPEMNGLELASRLIEQDDELMVVFVTGYNQYALEAFQVNALDYLLKPVNLNSIQKCVLRLLKFKGLGHQQRSEENAQRIGCLGNFEVYGNHGLIKWATRKVEEMLAYFIVHRNSSIEGWQLGEVLWPEEEPDKVRSNLHTTLYRLRKTIKEEGLPLEISSGKGGKGTYSCCLGPLFCDLVEFEEMARDDVTLNKTTIDKLESVCTLYKDELYSQKDYSWCESQKERLQRYYLNLLKRIAEFYVHEGRYQNSLDKLLTAAEIAPYDEEIQRDLLKIYDAQKNRASLISCYQQFKQRLVKEMGVEPQPETEKRDTEIYLWINTEIVYYQLLLKRSRSFRIVATLKMG
jgi:two-component SAPR family response regulator